MFGFFKKKEVAPPMREEVLIPKQYAERVIDAYSKSLAYGIKSKYDLWSLVESVVGEEIAAIKKKYPEAEKFYIELCVLDILHPKVIITKHK